VRQVCNASGSALAASDLWVRYGTGPWVLRGVDLAVETRDRLVILGANGAGKSTLLQAMAGLVPIDRGQISPQRAPGDIGLVLQDPDDQLFGATVADDVALGLIDRGMTTDVAGPKVAAVLAALGLADLAAAAVHTLSLGQRKRVALAGVLVTRPAVVLLDEPTAGLDPFGVAELLTVLDDLRAQGTAIVLSTHDTTLASEWADRVCVLHEGRPIAHGAPAQVLANHAALATARLRPPGRFTRPDGAAG
jgi:cobalt/nickel transport system ATP-binding protein